MSKMLLAILTSAVFQGLFAYPGSLHLAVTDDMHQPVTNVRVVVSALNRMGFNAGKNSSDFDRYEGFSDLNGIADVNFNTIDGSFRWWVDDPRFYVPGFKDEQLQVERLLPTESEKSQIAAERIALENGTGGDWLEVFRLGEQFTVVGRTITNSVRVVRKRNPRPLIRDCRGRQKLPRLSRQCTADGTISNSVERIGYDLEAQSPIPPCAQEMDGYVADFWITRSCVGTPSNLVFTARLDFAPGCGVYKATKANVDLGPFCYGADTNRFFSSALEYSYRLIDGRESDIVPIATQDEYLIMRTRAVENPDGSYSGWHYSLVSGPVRGWRDFSYDMILFNPTPDDVNLEYDE